MIELGQMGYAIFPGIARERAHKRIICLTEGAGKGSQRGHWRTCNGHFHESDIYRTYETWLAAVQWGNC